MNTYVQALRIRGVLRVTASQLLARLPVGMLSLVTLLHVRSVTGSLATAGALVAAMTVGEAVTMPVTGRLLGRLPARRVVVTLALAQTLALLGLAVAGSNVWLLGLLAVAVGVTVPPVMPAARALYPRLTFKEGVRALFALDTTAQELIFVVGPLVATLLAATGSTAVGLVVAAGFTLAGSLWFASTPDLALLDHGPASDVRRRGFGRVLGARPVVLAMVASAALMASFTALEVGVLTAYEHQPLMAGAVLAVPSASSLIGGLAWGHRAFDLRSLTLALLVVAGGTAGVVFAPWTWLVLVVLFVSGLGFAPALAALYSMVSSAVPPHASSETFGWLQTAALVGAAGGTAVGGSVGDAFGAVGGYATATALALLAAAAPLCARVWGPLRGLGPAWSPGSAMRQ